MAKAQVGDLIRIINVDSESYLKNGEIYEVTHIDDEGDVCFYHEDGSECYAKDDCYTIFRKAGEEDAPTCKHCGKTGVHTCRGPKEDAVNHPNHYTQGRFETIEIIEEITQGYEDGYVAYCVGNALKYLARAPFKHGEPTEDLRKAAKYLEFAIGRLTQNERNTIE